MTSRPAPSHPLIAALQAPWVLHAVVALILVIGLLLLVLAAALQVGEGDGRIWAPRPPASSQALEVPV